MTDYNVNIVMNRKLDYTGAAPWFTWHLQSRRMPNEQVDFMVCRIAGHGAHSKVFELVGRDGRKFAGKVSDCQSNREEDRRKAFEEVCKEAWFLKQLTDADYKYSPRFHSFSWIYGVEPIIMMELMGPSLGQLIVNPDVLKLSNRSISVAIHNMLSALNGMHELKFLCQDVKLENFCAVCDEDNSIVRVKLVDFGMTVSYQWNQLRECNFEAEEVKLGSDFCGTIPYTPRAGYVETHVAPLDDLESLFYQLLRMFGQQVEWVNERCHESYRRKVAFWAKEFSTLQPEILRTWFEAIRDSKRSSPNVYGHLVSMLRQEIYKFTRNHGSSSEIFTIKKMQ
ncbi:CK1 family protein kinase [Aphelenchoides besseyi]|nr:CK1 family protein kinase [Aphelenchoides besseyi]